MHFRGIRITRVIVSIPSFFVKRNKKDRPYLGYTRSVQFNYLFWVIPFTIWLKASLIGVVGRPRTFSKSLLSKSREPSRMLFWMSTSIGITKSGIPAFFIISA